MQTRRAFTRTRVLPILAILGCGGETTAPVPPPTPPAEPPPAAPPPAPPATATGTIEASVATSGTNVDPNGYLITLNGTDTQSVGADGTVTFRDVPAGEAELEIDETEFNCRVIGDNPRILSLIANGTAAATFQIHCVAPLRGRLVFQRNVGTSRDIYSASQLAGPDSVLLDQQLLIRDGMEPVVSPDGTKIAFTTFRDLNSEIYVASADGLHPINLTRNPAKDSEPTWSPDGTRIAFVRDGDVFVMNADGDDPERLVPGDNSSPSWSPDGEMIAFRASEGGASQIYTAELAPDPFRACIGPTPPRASVSASRLAAGRAAASAPCVVRRTSFKPGDGGVTPAWRETFSIRQVIVFGGVKAGILELDLSTRRVRSLTPDGAYSDPVYGGGRALAVSDRGPLQTVVVFLVDSEGRAIQGRPMARTGGNDSHPSWSR